jgi:hypothetical protein
MLKIWLTWLQPSAGILGVMLLLSNALGAYAATKPTVRNTVKAPAPVSQWSVARSNGTTLDRDLLTGIALPPDMAVRQLAISSLPSTADTTKTKTPQVKRNSFETLTAPAARVSVISAKTVKLSKPQQLKNNSVAQTLARAIDPLAPIPVPGIFIGNTEARNSTQASSPKKPVAQSVAAAPEIGAPTPLSAMQTATIAVNPFPVVRPELMQQLDRQTVAASMPPAKTGSQALNPIAAIPNSSTKVAGLNVTAPNSLDPIAAIPSGLQRVLGNDLNSTPVATPTKVAKTISIKPDVTLALKQIISPTIEAPQTLVSSASLRLATSQAYNTVVPKFNIPGEVVVSAKTTKSTVTQLVVTREQKNLTTVAVATRKNNYVATLPPVPKQSWMVVNNRNNLGSLTLGSQLPSVEANPMDLKTSTSTGLPARSLVNFN